MIQGVVQLADDVLSLIDAGDLTLLGLLPWSSNYTFLASASASGRSVLAVYKPCRGERPLWDFERNSLCRREVAAYRLSRWLGWPAVPPTVIRDGPHGPGSVQLYVDADPEHHFFSLRDSGQHENPLRQIALFDGLVNNADRKGGHFLLDSEGRVWAIDHGLTFHTERKLRTVIWDFAGETIPAEWLARLTELEEHLQDGCALWRELIELLDGEEVNALISRLGELLDTGHFPLPSEGRNVPYPLI